MKKLLLLSLLIIVQFSFGQNRFKPSGEKLGANDNVTFTKQRKLASNLSVIDQSKVSKSDKGYFYLLQVKNTTGQVKNYNFKVETVVCDGKKSQTDINFSFYDTSKTQKIKKLVVQPGTSKTFYVKTTYPENAKFSSWNCSNIIIYNPISNEKEVTKLVSNIIDPKNVH